ncbi:hypothetical protein BC940DRAFT_365727 [Gongronella butleri]|nr:hypothetical protein BC940DRAFT_365727 [Gongronella butleri]
MPKEAKEKKSKRDKKHKKVKKAKKHKKDKVKDVTTPAHKPTTAPVPDQTRERAKPALSSVTKKIGTDQPSVRRPTLPTANKTYESASDSDSTDSEARPMPSKSCNSPPKPVAPSKPADPSSIPSYAAPTTSKRKRASSTEFTTRNSTRPRARQVIKSTNPVSTLPAAGRAYASASDSDSSDDDAPPRKLPSVNPITKAAQGAPESRASPKTDTESESDDEDDAQSALASMASTAKASASTKTGRTKDWIEDSDAEASDTRETRNSSENDSSDEEPTTAASAMAAIQRNNYKLAQAKGHQAEKLGEYSNNRLQNVMAYRSKTKDAATEYKRRLVDEADKYNIRHNFFVSDSESDTDSDDDDDANPLPWHAAVLSHMQVLAKIKKDAWPVKVTGLTRMESIKLEKRVKKICRRHQHSLEDFQNDILMENASQHIQFWRKIVKPFPDRALHSIVEACRKMYNPHNYQNKPWTPEIDKQLIEYVKLYGTRQWKMIGEKMERTRFHCRARYTLLLERGKQPDGEKQPKVEWTDEEKDMLNSALSNYKGEWAYYKWNDLAINLFKGKRKGHELKTQWQKRNAKDGFGIEKKLEAIKCMQKHTWESEMDINFQALSAELGYPASTIRSFYMKARSSIPGYETKSISDRLSILKDRFEQMVAST